MRKAWAGFLVAALAAASTTPLCSDLAFAQKLPAQAAASQPAPEADASQSAQEPAGQAAANCPGHPDALGTSRVLALDPTKYPRVGRMQYPDSLPLNNKEVVLTFDAIHILYLTDYVYSEVPPDGKPADTIRDSLKDVPVGTPVEEIKRASDAFGLDFNFMQAVAKIESDFDPKQRTGSYELNTHKKATTSGAVASAQAQTQTASAAPTIWDHPMRPKSKFRYVNHYVWAL